MGAYIQKWGGLLFVTLTIIGTPIYKDDGKTEGTPGDHTNDFRLPSLLYVWVNSRSNMPMFCLKKLISQPRGGSKSTIFDTDDVDPLYFEVNIVSAPSDPPYMSKNAKMCYFYHFL